MYLFEAFDELDKPTAPGLPWKVRSASKRALHSTARKYSVVDEYRLAAGPYSLVDECCLAEVGLEPDSVAGGRWSRTGACFTRTVPPSMSWTGTAGTRAWRRADRFSPLPGPRADYESRERVREYVCGLPDAVSDAASSFQSRVN